MRYLIILLSACMLFSAPGIYAAESYSLNGGVSGVDIIDAQQNRTTMSLKLSEIELNQTEEDGLTYTKLALPDVFGMSVGAAAGPGEMRLGHIRDDPAGVAAFDIGQGQSA